MSIKTRMFNDYMSVRWLVANEPNFIFSVDYDAKEDSYIVRHEAFGTSESKALDLASEYVLKTLFKDIYNPSEDELSGKEQLFVRYYKDIIVALKLIDSNKDNLKLVK